MFPPSKGHRQKFFTSAEVEVIEAFERWRMKHLRKSGEWYRRERLKRIAQKAAKAQDRQERLLLFATTATSKTFYKSQAWLTLRFQAIQKYGRSCFSCGASPENGVAIHVDHIKPRFIWPELAFDINNLQILCERCNLGKGLHQTRVIRRRPSPNSST